jgi:hypothetical protein
LLVPTRHWALSAGGNDLKRHTNVPRRSAVGLEAGVFRVAGGTVVVDVVDVVVVIVLVGATEIVVVDVVEDVVVEVEAGIEVVVEVVGGGAGVFLMFGTNETGRYLSVASNWSSSLTEMARLALRDEPCVEAQSLTHVLGVVMAARSAPDACAMGVFNREPTMIEPAATQPKVHHRRKFMDQGYLAARHQ